MTSTISTLLAEVEGRMGITNAGAEPSNDQISDYLRQAFIDLFGVLKPPSHTTLTVGNTYTAALTHDQLFFVNAAGVPLFEWEFSSSGANVLVQSSAAERGDTLQVWYYAMPAITLGASGSATVDSSCILGDDWLQELAVTKAAMLACLRQINQAASNSPQDYGSLYRVLEETYNTLFQQHRMAWEQWYQQMLMGRQERAATGPAPVSYSGHVGFKNRSKVRNWLTGAGDSGVPQ